MTISAMMNAQTQQLQHTVSLSILQSSLQTQAAASIHMLDKMNETSPAPHPYAGKQIDWKA
ncbi:putative motility protein [Paenalkalicoccus suaedae]|uniref:Putative motility protein n=1 Tax=Paenalkalicoccus suaedae TaxID=2592382 RepID=A0A859FGF6_9BACI|nr:putative motility protein [Paenalkalicoccus suaedae]QKS72111.1 putative motility protein [Paenalkalicoccus suaedae]